MSSASVLNTMFGYDVSRVEPDTREEETVCDLQVWNVRRFGQEQIHSLVNQVFFPAGVNTPRQVVFSSVDQNANVGEICLQVGIPSPLKRREAFASWRQPASRPNWRKCSTSSRRRQFRDVKGLIVCGIPLFCFQRDSGSCHPILSCEVREPFRRIGSAAA